MASAVKWLQRWYQQRSARPEAARRERFAVGRVRRSRFWIWIAQRPDLTLVEKRALQNCASDGSNQPQLALGVFSTDTTSRSKSAASSRNGSEQDVAVFERAAAGYESKGMLDPARLVFIDETAVSTNMGRGLERASPAWRPGDWRRSAWKMGDDHLRGRSASQ